MLSFWEKNSFLKYDHIIIGGGIVGLSTACSIKEKNPAAEILILERGIFPTGASTKNAGFACFGSLTEILSDINLNGEGQTLTLIEKRWKGINRLRERLGDDDIGFLNYGGYELINEQFLPAVERVSQVNTLLRPIFESDVFELKNSSIKEFGFNDSFVKALVYSPFESQLDTGKMMRSLMRYAASLGVNVITGCDVAGFEDDGSGSVKVNASHNILKQDVIFSTGRLIICANAFIDKILPGSGIKPGRGQVVATKPIDGLKFRGIFHMDEGFYYFRNFGSRVIFGGGRNLDFKGEQTTDFAYSDLILNDLKEKLDMVILPDTSYEIEDSWSGIMAFNENKLPEIKQVSQNVLSVMSCNGMGVALSSVTGDEVAEMI